MRKLLPVSLALVVSLFLAISVRAQDVSSAGLNDSDNTQPSNVEAVADPQPAPAPAPQFAGGNIVEGGWEWSVGYQFTDFRPPDGIRFHNSGINTDITRFFGEWFGVEGDLGLGFGHTGQSTYPPNIVAKSLFVAGGVKFAYRSSGRFEPWGHVLIGLDHFRFNQTASGLGSNSALAVEGGGGVDIHLNPRLAIRGEGDYLATHFFKVFERNLQIVGGIVLDF